MKSLFELSTNVAAALGLATVLATILAILLKFFAKRRFPFLQAMSITTGVLTAFFPIFLKVSHAEVSTTDAGQQAIEKFYGYIESHQQWQYAWDMIHPDRKELIKKTIGNADEFAKAYATTGVYKNMQVQFDHAESGGKRFYWVIFDVQDGFPVNHLYSRLDERVADLARAHILNLGELTDVVTDDVQESYKVAPADVTRIRTAVANAKLSAVLSPKLIATLALQLKLTPKPTTGDAPFLEETPVWTHYAQQLILLDHEGWKIRDGLSKPVLEAYYEHGFIPPTMWAAAQAPTLKPTQ